MKVNKKFVKIVCIFLLLLVTGLIISNNIFAWDMNINKYENHDAGRAGEAVTNVVGAVINLASTVGTGVAIVMLIVIGIQYMGAGPDGKANAKKDLSGYVLGAVILFGVSGILKLLQLFIEANVNDV